MHFLVTPEPLDPQRAIELVRRDEAGAVVVFLGVVRNHNQGRRVLYLEYDAYPEMAQQVMQELAQEAKSRWPIAEVAVVHTGPSARGDALQGWRAEEAHYAGRRPAIAFRYVPVRDEQRFPSDIVSEEDAALLLRVLYREVAAQKRARRRVHLCIAGGRKVMAAYGMAVAQLLLDEEDRVWHLLSPPHLLQSRQMHAGADRVVLVPVPVLRWSLLPSTLWELLLWDDPYGAIQRQREVRDRLRRRMLSEFWRELTTAERQVALALARSGGSNQELELVPKCSGRPVLIANWG